MCFNDADKQHQIWRISSWLHGVGWVLKIYWFQAGQQWLHTSTHRNSILSMNVVHKYFTTKSILYCMHTLKNLTSVCYASFAVYFMPCIFLILVLAFISQFFRFCSALLVPFFFFSILHVPSLIPPPIIFIPFSPLSSTTTTTIIINVYVSCGCLGFVIQSVILTLICVILAIFVLLIAADVTTWVIAILEYIWFVWSGFSIFICLSVCF